MKAKRKKQGAFSMVEVTVAIGIAVFCLLAIFALLPVGLSSNRDSLSQTVAAGLAAGVVSDLRSTANSSVNSPIYNFDLKVSSMKWLREDGSVSATSTASGGQVYRVTVTPTPPVGANRYATMALVSISWPGNMDPAVQKPQGVYETVVGLDRN